VARLGGDEFAVLLRGVSGGRRGTFADASSPTSPRRCRIGDHTLVVRASIGVAPARAGDDLEGLLRNADIAMYAAKDSGKGAFQQYAPDMGARILRDRRAGHRAARRDRHRPVPPLYQPSSRWHRDGGVGAEALVRWRQPRPGRCRRRTSSRPPSAPG
jgi:predicted signal transduction protein with EAL and GGDEF domain